MEYKKIMIILILTIFLFSIASVCASDANDTAIASEDTMPMAQSDEISVNDDNQAIGQANEEEIISEGNVATFSELQRNITETSSGTLELDRNYEYDEGFDTSGIKIDNSITIDGKGYTIDAKGKARVFHIQANDVTIKNLTIINASYGGYGGAIYFSQSGSVINCNFADNTAYCGGAVYFWNNGNVTNCNFTDNTAYFGGAVYFLNTGNVTNCNFTNNKVTGDNGCGGAIYFDETGNVSNCNFANNKATADGSCGGAVYMNSGTVSNCNFTNNNASNNGGAIYFAENSNGNVTNCNFTNNKVTGNYSYGGAVYFWDDGTVSNCNFTNNQVTGSYPDGNGGAVYFWGNGNVTNCNFVNNTASGDGGAIWMFSDTVENCNFVNNTASNDGGAIWIFSGTVENCNFTNNKATGNYSYGGAIYVGLGSTHIVTNCNFTNNTASEEGGAICISSGTVANCNFTNNTARDGGAIQFDYDTGTVTNCNFTDNTAGEWGGAIIFHGEEGTVENCNFTGNNATIGSAIFYDVWFSPDSLTIFNSTFLNNRANADENTPLNVTINENNITITFMGKNNLINAIYSCDDSEVSFTNVTYWGANGITNTGSSTITPSRSNREAGQNITVGIVVNDEIVLNEVKVTDENGTIVLDISVGDNYYILVRHDEDSYYTEAEKAISNMKFHVNVTETETTNKTVNITAKSNIYNEVVPGKLLFILPNNIEINATYASNGTWWAVHTFEDYAFYQLNASYIGLDNLTVSNATINITRANSTVEVGDAVLNYGEVKNVVVTAQGATGITATIDNNPVKVINNYTIVISGLDAGTHTLTVTTIADEDHNPVTRNATITVNKAKTELSAKAVKTTYNVNKNLVITLKDSTGKALSGIKVSVNLNGAKTYTTDKNGQIKINVAKLVPKTYTTKVTFEGNANYLKSTANVKVTVKKAKPKITAKKKTYKLKSKNKKFTITLKDNKGKAIKKAKVTVKVIKIKKNSKKKSKKSGKKNILKAKTNKKGKATFKINRNSKGKYQVIIKYKGNKYYKSATKKVKIKIK